MLSTSYLFTPAPRLASLSNAKLLETREIVVDLEDAVHIGAKAAAREAISSFDFSALTQEGFNCGLRINSIANIEGTRDLDFIDSLAKRGDFPFTYIIIPKIRSHFDQLIYKNHFDNIPGKPGIIPLIETVEAIDDIQAIAALSSGLLFGQADLVSEMYAPNASFIAYARARLCIAASKCGILAIDTNSFEIDDMSLVERECQEAKLQGFGAKAAIHPVQVTVINKMFDIADDEIIRYRNIVATYYGSSKGFSIEDGRVVAPPFIAKAKRMLEYYESMGR